MPWRVRSDDHLGHSVSLRRLAAQSLSGGFTQPEAARIKSEVWSIWLPILLTSLGLLTVLIIAGITLLNQHGLAFVGLLVHGPIIAIALSTLVAAGQAAWWFRKRYAFWIETRSLSIAQCPSCGYDLQGATNGSPLVCCPECSASWRAEEVGRAVRSPRKVIVVKADDSLSADCSQDRSTAEGVRQLPLV